MADFPSLRDLETSNIYTKSNLNLKEMRKELQNQILNDPVRKDHLAKINASLSSKGNAGGISFNRDICTSNKTKKG